MTSLSPLAGRTIETSLRMCSEGIQILSLCMHLNFAKLSIEFFTIKFKKTIGLMITVRESNNLDPDQVRHFAGPDLFSNCLLRVAAEDRSLH